MALDAVNFAVRPGEVHALLGENGAGKSTLMNLLSGLLRPSGGQLYLNGGPVQLRSPQTPLYAASVSSISISC
ncbi:MAG: ATP-binding cassette domain-containing protein [Armatimonas sp.]